MLGMAQFNVREQAVSAVVQPYRFFLLQRVQQAYEELDEAARGQVEAMLAACGMAEILSIRLDRELGRADNLEVWL